MFVFILLKNVSLSGINATVALTRSLLGTRRIPKAKKEMFSFTSSYVHKSWGIMQWTYIYIQIIRILFLLLKKINKARLSRPPEILVLRWPALYLKSRIQCVVGFIGRPPYKSPQIPAGSESHRPAPGYVVCTCFRRYVNPLRTHPIL